MNLIEQDKRWNFIIEIHKQLVKKRHDLNRLWKIVLKEMDVTKQLSSDTHCVESVPLYEIDWYTTQFSISSGVAWEDYMFDDMNYDGKLLVPNCKKISSLIYSMFTFEHLKVSIQVCWLQ